MNFVIGRMEIELCKRFNKSCGTLRRQYLKWGHKVRYLMMEQKTHNLALDCIPLDKHSSKSADSCSRERSATVTVDSVASLSKVRSSDNQEHAIIELITA